MKITRITTQPFEIPLRTPFHLAQFTVYTMQYVLVTVETDNGICGYGEATPAWEVNGETPASICSFIDFLQKPQMTGYSILGETIERWDQVKDLITHVVNPHDKPALIAGNSAAKAALEQALFHAFVQYSGTPFHRLIDVPLKTIPVTQTIPIDTIDTSFMAVQQLLNKGATTIRLKVGKRDVDGAGFQRDIELIKRVDNFIQTIDRPIRLIADANQGFPSVKEAATFCRSIPEHSLDWLEQPLPAEHIRGFRELKDYTTVPLMADESMSTAREAELLLELGGIDYLNVKLMKTGGYFGALEVIDLAHKAHVQCHIGSMIESMHGIAMGCYTYLSRSKCVISTDLNVFDLLEKQPCAGINQTLNTVDLNSKELIGVSVKNNWSSFVKNPD